MANGVDLFGDPIPESSALNARFVVPPFSVLDARQGYWQDRKRACQLGRQVSVLAVSVSGLATEDKIRAAAVKACQSENALPPLEFVRAAGSYSRAADARLPDGTRLDPYYAAKALRYVLPGDCLWISGRRPDELK